MKIELDVHTHTIASGHAFSSLQEMARAAADRGLKLLGITEHTPGIRKLSPDLLPQPARGTAADVRYRAPAWGGNQYP